MNNRRIKYRFWGKREKTWIDIGIPPHGLNSDNSSFIAQQLVLILDDQTEIYEGDIVSWQDQQGYYETAPEGDILVVEWDDNYTKFICKSLTDGCKYDAGNCKIDMVMGNIFENPELINNN